VETVEDEAKAKETQDEDVAEAEEAQADEKPAAADEEDEVTRGSDTKGATATDDCIVRLR